MFSRDILKQDLNAIEVLKNQRDNCRKLIVSSIRDIVVTDNLSSSWVSEEVSTMECIHAQLEDLEKQITVLEEQMFLNYANRWQPNFNKNTSPNKPGTSFPHFDTIAS